MTFLVQKSGNLGSHFSMVLNKVEKSFRASSKLLYYGRKVLTKLLLTVGICLVVYEVTFCAKKLMMRQVGIRLFVAKFSRA